MLLPPKVCVRSSGTFAVFQPSAATYARRNGKLSQTQTICSKLFASFTSLSKNNVGSVLYKGIVSKLKIFDFSDFIQLFSQTL